MLRDLPRAISAELHTYVSLASALIGTFTYSKMKGETTFVSAVIIAIAFTTVFFFILGAILRQTPKRYRFRRILYPYAQYEGLWFQNVSNTRPYSISEIVYDPLQKNWKYSGIGFTKTAEGKIQIKARWRSWSLTFKNSEQKWYFFGDAEVFDPDTEQWTNGAVTTLIDFSSTKRCAFEGRILDDLDRLEAFSLYIYPIKSDDIENISRCGEKKKHVLDLNKEEIGAITEKVLERTKNF
mgnify:CR=1 FL=1